MGNVVGVIRRFLTDRKKARRAKPSELHLAIMQAYRVQTWFQYHRGVSLVRMPCEPCGQSRVFTVWIDGKYYCLTCLYAQVIQNRQEPIPLRVDREAVQDFTASWLAYRQRTETFEEPRHAPGSSAMIRLPRFSRPRPPPICAVNVCAACEGFRPFMRREDGDAGCIHCLMQGRIIEIEIEIANEAAA